MGKSGLVVKDPYRWLEDPDSAETTNFVHAQNNVTQPYLDNAPGREIIRKRLEIMMDYSKYGPPVKRGNKYFSFLETGLQNQPILYVQEGLRGEARELLDVNKLSEDGTVSIGLAQPSRCGGIYAYGISAKGSDWVTIYFKNVTTGKDLPDVLQHTKWPSIAWTPDTLGVFYNGYPRQNGTAEGFETTSDENMKVYYHKIGTQQTEDFIIAEFPDRPKLTVFADMSEDDKYLVITALEGLTSNLVYYIELDKITRAGYRTSRADVVPLLIKEDAKYYFIGNEGDVFYLKTDKDAPNYRLIGVYLDNPDEKFWSTLLPQHPTNVLSWATPINNTLMVTCYIHDVKSVLGVRRLRDGSLVKEIPLDIGTVGSYSGRRRDQAFFFSVSSFLYPGKIYRVDLSKGTIEPELYRESKTEGFDPFNYVTNQVFYKSKDGTRVPMFLVHSKNIELDGTAPTLLYGYGGFDISIQPDFRAGRIVFMQLYNGIIAVPNIRGGGEYGAKWHDGGRLLNKQNSFDDFQAAASWLIENKYTSASKLTIQGGSNGGLLIGACVNQRPDLFGVGVTQVGVLDLLRYQKFTIGYAWATDYGTSDNQTQFEYLIKYSPIHNVRKPQNESTPYPAILVLTGDHDDRVVPLHSYKFISELQYVMGSSSPQTNPLMIRVETNAGHGAGKPTSKMITEAVDMFSFMVQALRLEIVPKYRSH